MADPHGAPRPGTRPEVGGNDAGLYSLGHKFLTPFLRHRRPVIAVKWSEIYVPDYTGGGGLCAAGQLRLRGGCADVPPAPSPTGRRFQRPPNPHGAGRGCRAFLGGTGTATTRRTRAMFFSSGSPARLAGSAVPPRRLRLIPPRAPPPPPPSGAPKGRRRASPPAGSCTARRIWTTCSRRLCTATRPFRHGHHGGAGERGADGLGRRRSARCDGGRPFVAVVTRPRPAAVPPCRPRTMLRPLRPLPPYPQGRQGRLHARQSPRRRHMRSPDRAPRRACARTPFTLGSEPPPRHCSTRLPCG